jgi:Ca-activated chloride channel family protein
MFFKVVLTAFIFFQYTLSVDVDLVMFNVTVLDKDGKPVPGLTEKDFRVFEDGREEKVRIFQPEDTPATVGLVIDNSGSMSNKRNDVVSAASAFVDASHRDDEMFVVNFNRRVWMGLPAGQAFTTDHALVRETLQQTRVEGNTALYDAVKTALTHLNDGTKHRKALIVLSDGGDNSSGIRLDALLKLAQQSSATIYCIGIYDPSQRDRNPDALKKIAKATGGEAHFPKTLESLQTIWPQIAAAIRGQYTIGYVSSNSARDGGFRKVKITANQKKKALDVRTRTGYIAGKSS